MTAVVSGAPTHAKWPRVELDDLCERKTGNCDPCERPDSEFTYIDISSVDNARKEIVEARRILGKDAPSRARQIVFAKDVLVSTTRPNLNAVAVVPDEFDRQIASTGFCVLRPRSELDAGYLFAFVQSEAFVRKLSDLVQGSLYPAVSDQQVRAQKIPLPPLAEQQRIAARLREQLAAAETARQAVAAQLAAALALPAAFTRDDTHDPTTVERPLGEVLDEVTAGIGAAWRGQPVLGATRAGLAPAREGVGKLAHRYKPVTAGTVFYNPMRILLGSIALVDEGDTPGITSPDYVAVRGREGVLHAVWFYAWFRSPAGAEFIKSLTRGAVRERLLFNRVAPGRIPVPPWPRQLATVARIRAADQARRAFADRLEVLEKLPAALLRAAFSPVNGAGA